MSRPAPLIIEVKKGQSVPFDGVVLDTWATAELYTQKDLCFEVRELIREQPPYEFFGGVGTGAFLVLLGTLFLCKVGDKPKK